MSAVRSSGFHMAAHVVPGTVISEVYFAVPIHGTIGDRFETINDALADAIAKVEQRLTTYDHRWVGDERATIDVRWVMTVPAGTPISVGGSSDAVAERYSYDTLAEMREHLARLVKYARA